VFFWVHGNVMATVMRSYTWHQMSLLWEFWKYGWLMFLGMAKCESFIQSNIDISMEVGEEMKGMWYSTAFLQHCLYSELFLLLLTLFFVAWPKSEQQDTLLLCAWLMNKSSICVKRLSLLLLIIYASVILTLFMLYTGCVP